METKQETMKNIHILPTDKPSRLFKDDNQVLNLHTHSVLKGIFTNGIGSNQHIYITSDEEIKEGDWIINTANNFISFASEEDKDLNNFSNIKKIILTTDQDLIADGVQVIDDEFLEWFVNNPSCEEVEVILDEVSYVVEDNIYKIIIPKEEPKQIKCYCGHTIYCDCGPLEEPKQERMYSEEDMKKAFKYYSKRAICNLEYLDDDFKDFMEQFKKK